jgi:uncharacterized protein (TIGR02996 family)
VKKRKRRTWPWNAALEDAIREDPLDDGNWSVYVDWILEHEDARAPWLRAQSAGDENEIKLFWELKSDLLESSDSYKDPLAKSLGGSSWRACYIDLLRFHAPANVREALFAVVLAKRAASLARAMEITIDQTSDLTTLPRMLPAAPCARSLRRLLFACYWSPARQHALFDTEVLSALALDELRFTDRAVCVPFAEPLARLRQLAVIPGSVDDLLRLFDGVHAKLRRLDLDVTILEVRGGDPLEGLGSLIAGDAAPGLEVLNLRASAEVFATFLDRLATSPLAKRLRSLEQDRVPLTERDLATWQQPLLGHLCG